MTDAAATCPLCGAAVAIVGRTTLHYEPTTTAAEVIEAQRQRIAALELALQRVVQRADAMVAGCCGADLEGPLCELHDCDALLELVAPLRDALAAGR